MSESSETSSTDHSSLTPIETVRFQFTRCLIFVLSIVGVGLSFLGGYYVILCYVFVFVCPMLANFVWWQSRFALAYPAKLSLIQGKQITPPRLTKPQFWLPIVEYIFCLYKQHAKKQSEDPTQSPLVRFESSSLINPCGKFQTWLVNRQNNVVVAIMTSCCQVYGCIAFIMLN